VSDEESDGPLAINRNAESETETESETENQPRMPRVPDGMDRIALEVLMAEGGYFLIYDDTGDSLPVTKAILEDLLRNQPPGQRIWFDTDRNMWRVSAAWWRMAEERRG
jgi:hypothetical protein